MAKFKLYINNNNILIPFTDFDSNIQLNQDYEINSKLSNSFYNYSEDEQLSLHKNSQAELKFSMNKFITINDTFTFNPFINQIKCGTIIRLEDQYQNNRDFWVNDIKYHFSKINLKYEFTCQDLFSYTYSRRNNGYQIQNNFQDFNFIGAKSIDFWAKKIMKECNISYFYLPIEPPVNISSWKISNNLKETLNNLWWAKENKKKRSDYNRVITFEISNSNGFNALISLGQEAGLVLEVNDKEHYFYFKPEKNEHFNGLYYSPNVDLKTFSLSESGNTLVSILNVEGRKLQNNTKVSLIPDFNENQKSLLLTIKNYKNGLEDQYFNGYYKQMLLDTFCFNDQNLSQDLLEINNSLDRVPWLENKIINFNYFWDQHLIQETEYVELWNLFYNKLRRANKEYIYYNNLYFSKLEEKVTKISQLNYNIDSYYANLNANIINPYVQNAYNIENLIFNTESTQVQFSLLWPIQNNKIDLIKLQDLINQTGKDLVNKQQDFLKNIFQFQELLNNNIISKTIIIQDNLYSFSNTIDSEIKKSLITDLTTYWSAAYNSSWYCEYFLPETCFIADPNNNSNIIFDNKALSFRPVVNIQYQPYYNYYYVDRNSSEALIETSNILKKYVDNTHYWGQKEENLSKQLVYMVNDNTGCTWNQLRDDKLHLHNFGDNTTDISLQNIISQDSKVFGGINCILLTQLIKYYQDTQEIEKQREKSLQKHNDVWREIYSKYGKYILEQFYQDKTANSSEELYNNAMNYFKDISIPEKQYNMSIINIAALKGYKGDQIQISDQIRIAAEEFYGEHDDLKEAIRQPLFITDISYNLRSDEEIKLTVNAVKYQDKVIQRLVSLIK